MDIQHIPKVCSVHTPLSSDPLSTFPRPGMTRLNFPYFMNEQAIAYIIEAVKMVAREGWKLLPQVSDL